MVLWLAYGSLVNVSYCGRFIQPYRCLINMIHITDKFWQWVDEHSADDPAKLRLKYHGAEADGVDLPLAITQIECRRKFGTKLAETLQADPHFLFPGAINGEQSTGDRLAQWHAGLIPPGSHVADLTAGLGIDALHVAQPQPTAADGDKPVAQATAIDGNKPVAQSRSRVTALERDEPVAQALAYNARTMGLDNLTVICEDSTQWIHQQADSSYDWLFIDPARRAADGSRVFDLSDCAPDLTQLQTEMLRVAPAYVAKLSPMLDISRTASQLTGVTRIYIVGTATECKELVAMVCRPASEKAALTRQGAEPPRKQLRAATAGSGYGPSALTIEAVTLLADGTCHSIAFTAADEREAEVSYGMPKAGDWLLEPYPAVMKAAPHRLLCSLAKAVKIAPNTHVYFASQPGDSSLGRWLQIEAVLPYSSGEIKRFKRRWPQALVAERNFGLSAQALRTKLAVKDGGTTRVLGVTDPHDRRWLIVAG